MSTAQALRNLDRDLERELVADLGNSKVVQLQKYEAADPEAEADSLSKTYRKHIARTEQTIADVKKQTRATVASFEADIKALRAKIDETKGKSATDIKAAERVLKASKAALAALNAE